MPQSDLTEDDKIYVLRAALASLAARMVGWDEHAADWVYDVQDRYGGRALAGVITYWVAALESAVIPKGLPEGALVMPLFRPGGNTDAPFELADDVPAPAAWAGRVVAAYLGGDADTFGALLTAIPDGEGQHYVPALLSICAEGIGRAGAIREFMATTSLEDLDI